MHADQTSSFKPHGSGGMRMCSGACGAAETRLAPPRQWAQQRQEKGVVANGHSLTLQAQQETDTLCCKETNDMQHTTLLK